ncbi:nucleoside-diphosphate-sugar epimerase [Fusarium albosuccineum]|uniref:Nucleoside-diphosphate-sugar epimerase n=1 Tax=Fusarium albosuccineum TaxID=1237068 RepID=A0A8H4L257_9HYPO|nr:nucleoside-diphosphate-sugar epimerase [Fusarium albosuccineum]
MERVKASLEHALQEGLKTDKTNLDVVTGQSDAAGKIGSRTYLWVPIERNLWGDERDPFSGLLSGLKNAAADTTNSVDKAWKACSDALPAVQRLEKACSAALKAGEPLGPSFADTLRPDWNIQHAAQTALEKARTGSKSSITTLLAHLAERNQNMFQDFWAHARDLEDAFDKVSRERHLLENEYERLRWDAKGDLTFGGSKEWAQLILYVLRQFVWSEGKGICHPDYNSTNFYKATNQVADLHMKSARLLNVKVKDNEVIWANTVYMGDLETDRFREINWIVWIPDKYFPEYRKFCQAWYRMQATLNALSRLDGPWAKEKRDGDAVRATVFFRERLNASLDNLEDLAESVKAFDTVILGPVVTAGKALACDLQDLFANIFYGDHDDQKESLAELVASVNQWIGDFKAAEMIYQTATSTIPIRNRIGIVDTTGHSLISQASVNRHQAIIGLCRIELACKNTFSVFARQDERTEMIKVDAYDGCPSKPLSAQALMMEIPSSRASECGRVDIDQQPVSNKSWSFPIRFINKYTSPPKVVCWMEGFEIVPWANIRINSEAENITAEGFTLRLWTWHDTDLRRFNVSWFAHTADHPHIVSGRHGFTKRGLHSDDWVQATRVAFPKGKFPKRRPQVFAAIHLLDLNNGFNARCRVVATDVTQTGMKIGADCWLDTDCYGAGFTYLAFDEDFYNTGASGYTGGSVLNTLVTAHPEYDITVLLREPSAAFSITYPGVRVLKGDFDSSKLLKEAASKASIVVHHGNSDHEPAVKALIAGLLERASASLPAFYIHLGGSAIISQWDNLGELHPKIWSDIDDVDAIWSFPVESIHRNTELLIQEAWSKHGDKLKTAIVCPPNIHGRGTGPIRIDSFYVPSLYAESLKLGATFYLGSGSNIYSRVHIEDVAQVFLRLVEAAADGGQGAEWGRQVCIRPLSLVFASNSYERALTPGAGQGYYFTPSEEVSQFDIAVAAGKTLKSRVNFQLRCRDRCQ